MKKLLKRFHPSVTFIAPSGLGEKSSPAGKDFSTFVVRRITGNPAMLHVIRPLENSERK